MPLVIGKILKLRCFKNVNLNNLPIIYQNNSKAWMLSTLFQEWLQEFDNIVGQKHREQCVLLLIDNYSSYKLKNLTLSYVDIYFLPPNITLKL